MDHEGQGPTETTSEDELVRDLLLRYKQGRISLVEAITWPRLSPEAQKQIEVGIRDSISRIRTTDRDIVILPTWSYIGSQLSGPFWVRDSQCTAPYREFHHQDGRTLTEHLFPLPSAPLYSIHRKRGYNVTLPRLSWHTLRLIKDQSSSRIDRLYILHNGLNEIDSIGFFYELARQLIMHDANSAVIIRPFPGHLTRQPFPMAYAQRPLDTYLSDAGNLFRQYLRYMLESQWLISILAPCADYRTIAGLDLLARSSSKETPGNRHDADVLASAIHNDWKAIWETNRGLVQDMGAEVDSYVLAETIRSIRSLINWERNLADASNSPSAQLEDWRPFLHVVGYSLGGFAAQSIFFTWPFAIASCTTICSGGALTRTIRKSRARVQGQRIG